MQWLEAVVIVYSTLRTFLGNLIFGREYNWEGHIVEAAGGVQYLLWIATFADSNLCAYFGTPFPFVSLDKRWANRRASIYTGWKPI
jgi:hypothetical protein